MNSNRLFFYMLISFSFLFSQKNFDLLSTGGSKVLGNICQNPAVREKGKYLGLEGRMPRGHAGWEKNENKNEVWDHLFFKAE